MPVLIFFLLIAFVPAWPDEVNAPRWALLSLAVPVLLFTIQRVRLLFSHITLTAFLVWAGFSLLRTPDFFVGIDTYWHFLLFGGLFLLAPADMRSAYIAAGFAMCINSLATVLQLFGAVDWEWVSGPGGLFLNKNLGAEVAALVIVGLAGQGGRSALLALGAAFPLLVQPFSRGAIAAVVVAGWLALWHYSRFIAALTIVLATGWALRFVQGSFRGTSIEKRVEIWSAAWDGLTLWGHGLGSFAFAFPVYEWTHNDLLHIGYELGAPGVLLFASFFGYCLWRGALTERLVVLAFLVEGLFAFPLFMPGTLVIVALASGSLCRNRVPVRGLFSLGQFRDYAREGAGSARAGVEAHRARSDSFPA